MKPSLQIEYLNLSGNLIKDFKMDWISPFIYIKRLNLDNNQLLILDNDNWIQSSNLTHLYLKNNDLLQVDVDLLVYLEHLDLSFNKFSQFSVEFYRPDEFDENNILPYTPVLFKNMINVVYVKRSH